MHSGLFPLAEMVELLEFLNLEKFLAFYFTILVDFTTIIVIHFMTSKKSLSHFTLLS